MIKGLDKLDFLSPDQISILNESEKNYKRFASVFFEVIDFYKITNEVIVKVWQNENNAANYLPEKELITRAKDVFTDFLPKGVKLHIRPVPYEKDKLLNLTIDDVKQTMQDLGLQQKDLVKLLDMDKTSISRLFNEIRPLTNIQKAMFFYLFEYLKIKK